jgi:MerR family copper efflux transcriptional regulator
VDLDVGKVQYSVGLLMVSRRFPMAITRNRTQPVGSLLRIGEIQHQSQVPIKTIRYYEALGLISSVKRTDGGFRLFSLDVLPRLAFIKQAQKLGLSLAEIKEILAIRDHGKLPCHEVQQRFQAKIQEIDEQIAQLSLLKAQLLNLINHSPGLAEISETTICPIIEGSYQDLDH